MQLQSIGYWKSGYGDEVTAVGDDDLEHPIHHINNVINFGDVLTQEQYGFVLEYLRGRLPDFVYLESHELGYSYCRFRGCCSTDPKEMGACTLTDGKYVWPEGYVHYVEQHQVQPPMGFLQHICEQFQKHKKIKSQTLSKQLLLWDVETQKPVPLPKGMKMWLDQHTTLRTVL